MEKGLAVPVPFLTLIKLERMIYLRHPSQKFLTLHQFMLLLTIVSAICAIIYYESTFWILLIFYFLSLSFLFEGIAYRLMLEPMQFYKQMIRAVLLLVFSSMLYF